MKKKSRNKQKDPSDAVANSRGLRTSESYEIWVVCLMSGMNHTSVKNYLGLPKHTTLSRNTLVEDWSSRILSVNKFQKSKKKM